LHLLEKLHCLLQLPILHIFCKLLIPCKKCSIAMCFVPLQLSLLPPMAGFVSPQARVLPVSSCVWNLDTFHLSTTRNPDQADQPCIFHIPDIIGIIRIEKSALTFCISIWQLPTFSSLLLLSHQCKGLQMNFCQG
jgi:hypothetical protein